MALTNTRIHNAKPANKTIKLFDSEGLYIEISPAGRKWWRLKYRIAGKEKRISLGVYPAVSLKDARERRNEARKLLTNGVDPSEHRKAIKASHLENAANSFEVVAREWLNKYSTSWTENHTSRTTRRFERDVFPWIGQSPIIDN